MSRKRVYNHDEMRALNRRGFDVKQIAAKFGCAQSTVRAALDRDYAEQRNKYSREFCRGGGPPPRAPTTGASLLSNL